MDNIKNLPWYGQIGVFLVLGAVILALFIFLYYNGVQDQINKKKVEIEKIQSSINASKLKIKELEQIKIEIKNKEKTLKVLDQILPEKRNISNILNNIQSLISGTQQEFKRMSKGIKKSKKLFIEYSYTINARGNYHNLGTFFDKLSNLKKIFNVTGLTISPIKKKGGFNSQFTINSTFRLSTYIQQKRKNKGKKGRR